MIQASKNHRNNLLFVIIFGILFFTPLGTFLKVSFLRLISVSPSVENVENQQKIYSYTGSISDGEGNIIDFEKFKNKIVIVNFWATWCPPCIAEMPSLQSLYNDYKDKVDFLFITGDSYQKVEDFMKKNQYHMPVYYNEQNLPSLLHSNTIPATFLISSEGKILIKEKGVANWNSTQVRQILDQELMKN